MKILVILCVVLLNSSFAGTLIVEHPCEPSLSIEEKVLSEENLGQFVFEFLNREKIPFLGNSLYVKSIWNTPIDLDAFEVVSNTEMYAWGWCFSVNGVVPDVYANRVNISKDDRVRWFFAYAKYKDGEWSDYCQNKRVTPFCSSN